ELSGEATIADYETALVESLTFESTSDNRDPREFEFTVFDGDKHSNTMEVTVDIGGCSLNTNPEANDEIDPTVTVHTLTTTATYDIPATDPQGTYDIPGTDPQGTYDIPGTDPQGTYTGTGTVSWTGPQDISHVTYLVEASDGTKFYAKTNSMTGLSSTLDYTSPLELVSKIETNTYNLNGVNIASCKVLGYEIKAGGNFVQVNIDANNKITTVDNNNDANYNHNASSGYTIDIDDKDCTSNDTISDTSSLAISGYATITLDQVRDTLGSVGSKYHEVSTSSSTENAYYDDGTWYTDSSKGTTLDSGDVTIEQAGTSGSTQNAYYDNGTWYTDSSKGTTLDLGDVTIAQAGTSGSTQNAYYDNGTWYTDSSKGTTLDSGDVTIAQAGTSASTQNAYFKDEKWYSDEQFTNELTNPNINYTYKDQTGNDVNDTNKLNLGDGIDRLKVDFANNESIDFTELSNVIDNVEIIDFTDAESQTIDISLDDVLEMTDEDNTITIKVDDADTLDIETDGWTETNSDADNIHTYEKTTDGVTDSITLTVDTTIDTI
ncbi:MAG: hypothetical protein U9R16_06055, partial [Campylobacterota bacterium]|nr:hypothetical protein [Campylobacterota bacterium]